jgi:hypothetical protein
VWDVLSSLGDLGVSLEELDEYCVSEGKDLGRYASSSARRLDDLLEFRGIFHKFSYSPSVNLGHYYRLFTGGP